jgi:hypothetical protein
LKKKRDVQDHSWLFVDRKGRPFGCPEETAEGGGRDTLRLKSRLGVLRKQWQSRCRKVAAGLGKKIPAMPREVANHAVRNAMGFAIYQELGLKQAANYLGDREGSIENVYTGVSGRFVDTTDLAAEFQDWQPPSQSVKKAAKRQTAEAVPVKPTDEAGGRPRNLVLEKRLNELTDQLFAGSISEAEYDTQAQKLERAMAR